MKEDLFTIILAIVVPMVSIYIGYKTKNMGQDEKYNHRHPSCLDNSAHIETKSTPKCTFCHKDASEKFTYRH